jgi:hypothetical protein
VFRYLFQTTVELYTVVDYLIRICVSWCLWRKGEGYKASLLNSCSGIQSIATWTLTSGDVLKEDFINVSWATYQACGLTRRAHTICNFWCCGCSSKLLCDVQRLSPVTGLAQHVPTADDRGCGHVILPPRWLVMYAPRRKTPNAGIVTKYAMIAIASGFFA